MLVEKVYAETIDVRDPEDYCAHPEPFVMTYLRRRYVNRCWGGAFIVKILKILALSDCRIKETDLSAEGYVDVKFLALVSCLGLWDVITGVKIVDRGQMVLGRSETEGTVIVTLASSPQAAAVRVDQVVAVRVLCIQYTPNQSLATAAGVLLTCDRTTPAYAVASGFSAKDARDLLPLVAQIKSLLAARSALMKEQRDAVLLFEALLYTFVRREGASAKTQTVETANALAWEGPESYPLPREAAAVNLVTFVEEAAAQGGKGLADTEGTWSRDLTFYRSSPLAARVPQGTAPPPWWSAAVAASPLTAFTSMLTTVYNFLTAVNAMARTYSTAALLESHKNIWHLMRTAQLPAP